jgi:6-phosphogluconolactonase
MTPELIRTKSFNDEVARFIADSAAEAIAERGVFRLALSGGKTPRSVYQALSMMNCQWPKWILTFGDERCVPPDDRDSNYRMATESFLMVTTPGEVLRIKGECPPEEAAEECDVAIQSLAHRFREPRYKHDLILLGMGDDGHTASLFPGTEALNETKRNVVANFVPKFNAYRITFTYPLLNASRCVAFLVNDKTKEPLIQEIKNGNTDYPAARVKPEKGELIWFIGS